jgi:hypothetical protein
VDKVGEGGRDVNAISQFKYNWFVIQTVCGIDTFAAVAYRAANGVALNLLRLLKNG